eukprot:8324802-Ditylum_brightwellii.AAC.1
MVIISLTLSGLSQMRVDGKRDENSHAMLCSLKKKSTNLLLATDTTKLTKKCANVKNDANNISKGQCQTVETTQSNGTPYDDDGTKIVRLEIPPSGVPHSEEQG